MSDPESATTLVQKALGQSISRVEQAAWGFQNRADIVTLANGDRVVLQRYRRRDVAERRIAILRALAEPAAAGIAIPAACARTTSIKRHALHTAPETLDQQDAAELVTV